MELIDEKSMLVYAIAVTFLTVIVVGGFGKCLMAAENITEVNEQIKTMNQYVTEYGNVAANLNQQAYRPVQSDQIDSVQSNLLLVLQANNLDLLGFKNIKQTGKETAGQTFELDFNGLWPDTVKVIRNFHARDALISIDDVKFTPEKTGKVKTTLQYKIYIK